MSKSFEDYYQEVKSYVVATKVCNVQHIKNEFNIFGVMTRERFIRRLEEEGIVEKFEDIEKKQKCKCGKPVIIVRTY
ncbi:hypothetical protein [Paenisporosarcina indica]|uniref:hypothetical protein n=1 Tax=Paenisporosarcina indica TaxID=650093 RepID=UPI00094FF323|nr:hypothetical protein [Paenisporosarcina indica]